MLLPGALIVAVLIALGVSFLREPGGSTQEALERSLDATDQLVAERQRHRNEILAEIGEVEANIETITGALGQVRRQREAIGALVVRGSRFYFREEGSQTKSVIEVTVRNDTQQVIGRAHFHGVLFSSGRTAPWAEADFNYLIPDGLAPAATETWHLIPGPLSAWANAPRNRVDLILTVTTFRIDDADGKPLYNLRDTKPQEEERFRLRQKLELLRERLEETGEGLGVGD